MIEATVSAKPAEHQYTYRETLAVSERSKWRVEEIIGGDRRLDFSKPFMPESLALVEPLDFLSAPERLALNQIRGHAYLCIFGIVEEFILPFLLDHARPQLFGDDYRVRALLQFAGEEAKHIHLFRRFREEFERGFGTPCAVIGPAEEIGRAVLAHDPLAVALTILQIEWMTQSHYLDSVKDDQELDPLFKSLLQHHWIEEAQHAKLDTLMVEALAEGRGRRGLESAFEEYVAIGRFIDAGLMQQVGLDAESLARATGRVLTDAERERFTEIQRRANRWTYIGSGMTHPNFLDTLGALLPGARERVERLTLDFC